MTTLTQVARPKQVVIKDILQIKRKTVKKVFIPTLPLLPLQGLHLELKINKDPQVNLLS